MFVECRNKPAREWQSTDDSGQPSLGLDTDRSLLCGPAEMDRASPTTTVRREGTILNSDVRSEAMSGSQVGGPDPKEKLWCHSGSTIGFLDPHPTLPRELGPLPTLVGPLP